MARNFRTPPMSHRGSFAPSQGPTTKDTLVAYVGTCAPWSGACCAAGATRRPLVRLERGCAVCSATRSHYQLSRASLLPTQTLTRRASHLHRTRLRSVIVRAKPEPQPRDCRPHQHQEGQHVSLALVWRPQKSLKLGVQTSGGVGRDRAHGQPPQHPRRHARPPRACTL